MLLVLIFTDEEFSMCCHYEASEQKGSWLLEADILFADAKYARAVLYNKEWKSVLSVCLEIDDKNLSCNLDTQLRDQWKREIEGKSGIMFDRNTPVHVTAVKYEGIFRVYVTLSQSDKVIYEMETNALNERILSSISKAGMECSSGIRFSDFTFEESIMPQSPAEKLMEIVKPKDDGFYLALARLATDDLISNFWTGDTKTGKIAPTWSGFTGDLPDERGSIWETAMLYFCIYDMWRITGDSYYYDLISAEANFFRNNFTAEELENAGGLFNWASDDCAWNAMMLISYYTVTGDQWFLDRAIGLLDNVDKRWYDAELDGIYYKDDVDYMSLYEVGIAWAWLQIWEISGEQRFYDLALRSYSQRPCFGRKLTASSTGTDRETRVSSTYEDYAIDISGDWIYFSGESGLSRVLFNGTELNNFSNATAKELIHVP